MVRKIFLRGILTLAVALLGAPEAWAAEGAVIVDRSFSSQDGATLALDTDRGGLTVRGEARDTIAFKATVDGIDPEEAKKLLELTVSETPAGLTIRARYAKNDSGWLSGLLGGRGNIHYDVRVPVRTHLSVDNGSGGVEIEGIEGNVALDNGSGGIMIRSVTGAVTIDNGSGGVEVARVRGDLTIDNGSGGIDAAEVVGAVKIDNGSGGIDLRDVDGALDIETSSGGIRARMSGKNAGINARSGSGGVEVVVPAGWSADLDLSTGSGHVLLQGWKEASVGSAKSFRGQVGGGGPLIRLASGSGEIELVAR